MYAFKNFIVFIEYFILKCNYRLLTLLKFIIHINHKQDMHMMNLSIASERLNKMMQIRRHHRVEEEIAAEKKKKEEGGEGQ